ncbi:MAG TPA: hypothetical protein VIS49_04435 [Cyclobacteriaceae bacterium]
MLFRIVIFVLFCFSFSKVSAQKRKTSDESNSFDPKVVDERFVPEKSIKRKKGRFGRTYEARKEFHDRIEKNWKEREKREKNVSGERKPDKSQPPYFGHKRPPKIRPAGKQKMCKICHIMH